ncbi:MAG: hypothetical protein ACI9R3_003690 [Verrucomicrobiales bacterium]|jgi:hypothetical protein
MNKAGTLIIVACLVLFLLGGIYEVFRLRFQAGDTFPEYSTLRADPLGAKAAYDTIDALDNYSLVTRNRENLRFLKVEPDSTLLFAGVTGDWLNETLTPTEFEVLDTAIQKGARCVMTLSGRDNAIGREIEIVETGEVEHVTPDEVLEREANRSKKKPINIEAEKPVDDGDKAGAEEDESESQFLGFDAIKERWQFDVGYTTTEDWDLEEGIAAKVEVTSPLLGAEITVRSPWRFAGLGPMWKPVATIAGRPVIMQRPYGKGTLVMCADSWFLSNESLAKYRELGPLLWAVGKRSNLVVDETHHGVQESEGVVGMVARYHLHGVIPGVILLFLLVLWRGSSSLVPSAALSASENARAVTVDGIDADSGVVRLMRSGISKQEILRQCYLAWARHPVLRRRYSKTDVAAVRDRVVAEESKSTGQRDLVSAYREIAQSLSRRPK